MKTVCCFSSHARIAALALLAAWLAGPGDGRAQLPGAQLPAGLSCQKVPPEGHVTSNPIACTVSCAKGGKLASALALAPRTTAGLTVTINGTCIEAVDQVPGNVTLQGASSGRWPAGAQRVEQSGSRHRRRRGNARQSDDFRRRECVAGAPGSMRQDVGLQPNLSRNHRENALGPENPSRYATSDREV